MTDITQIAHEHKQQNGNAKIKREDLIWYIVNRIDKMHERIDEMNKTFVPKWLFIWIIGGVCLVLGYIITQVHALK